MAWNTTSLSQFSAPFSSVNQGQTREMIREVLEGLNLEGKGDREKAYLIYDWIARTVSYESVGSGISPPRVLWTACQSGDSA